MKILLVEDDLALSEALSKSLRQQNYAVNCVHNGKDALLALADNESNLLVLDLGLPDMDGLKLLDTIRRNKNTIPTLILTARDTLLDKIEGLDKGADDYLAKPFDMDELLARLRVMERRLGTSQQSVIECGPVRLDATNHLLLIDGESVETSRREFTLLKSLMENVGRIQSKHQLESKLYEWGDEVASNTIEVHIHNLRKKLPADFIKTVRGVGYSVNQRAYTA
ncbi:response regulator [Aliiglaciecola sp. LCG003]|uniref:response regulator n=1 Tax=Aliiglaciecola sp. LCG003 TaxID=3053655 RepID=UPI002574382E|nr:response regulator [Aliiglaciecola sp. LCG003]WJG09263.1 response regulator [Aliiglaciecola sp. LCG003]